MQARYDRRMQQRKKRNTRRRPPEERFWEKVDRRGPDECWEWTGGRFPTGYGIFNAGKGALRSTRAHRYSYELAHGPIPVGVFVCHRCDNPPCVNPAHLFAGSRRDNDGDKVRKLRHAHGERHGAACLTDREVALAREKVASGATRAEIASRMGVHPATVAMAVNGRSWKHLPGAIPSKARKSLTEGMVAELRRLCAAGWPPSCLAGFYGASVGTIHNAIRGRTWAHIQGPPPYTGTLPRKPRGTRYLLAREVSPSPR